MLPEYLRNIDILGGVLAALAGLVWLVRLEGRINVLDRISSQLSSDVSEIKHDVKSLLIRMGPTPWRNNDN